MRHSVLRCRQLRATTLRDDERGRTRAAAPKHTISELVHRGLWTLGLPSGYHETSSRVASSSAAGPLVAAGPAPRYASAASCQRNTHLTSDPAHRAGSPASRRCQYLVRACLTASLAAAPREVVRGLREQRCYIGRGCGRPRMAASLAASSSSLSCQPLPHMAAGTSSHNSGGPFSQSLISQKYGVLSVLTICAGRSLCSTTYVYTQ
jgi:hypothetical protein